MKVTGPIEHQRLDDEERMIGAGIQIVCDAAEFRGMLSLSVFESLMGCAAETFAGASVTSDNGDDHIAGHLDAVCEKFKTDTKMRVEEWRLRQATDGAPRH